MIHVADLERSIDFYTRITGMSVLRRGEMPAERRRNAFVGYGSEDETAVLELTACYDRDNYNAGDAFGHLALGFADVGAACAAIAAAGGNVSTHLM
jgi:lactoylglutathione lyase